MNDDFSIRTTPTYLDGLFMALVGIPDLWAIVDSPRCVGEILVDGGMQGHAWRQRVLRRDGNDRLFTTDIDVDKADTKLVEHLLRRLRQVSEQFEPPRAVIVSDMIPARLVGNDTDGLAREIQREMHVPCGTVRFVSLTRDYLDAFEASLEAVAEVLPEDAFGAPRNAVAVIGYLMDRCEADHTANVAELESLLQGMGLETATTWTSGRPVAELREAASCQRLIALPYGRNAAAALARRSGAEVLELDVPIGLDGTARWLRQVASFAGCESAAETLIKHRLETLVPLIAPFIPRVFARRRVAVIAEPALAAGFCAYFEELGIEVVGPLYRCRRPDQLPPGAVAERSGLRCYDPSVNTITGLVNETPSLDLMVGSSREHEVVVRQRVPFLELGFPSFHYRPLVGSPYVGFAGALHLAHRLSLKLEESAYERLVNGHA